MKNVYWTLGSLVALAMGIGTTMLADHYGVLPGLPKDLKTPAADCPHKLSVGSCPFCDKTLIEKEGQCGGHDVPEALCYQCRPALIPAFKAIGDWCGGHDVPESQCYDCNPELLQRKAVTPPSNSIDLLSMDDLPRSLRPPKLGCRTHTLKVQFKSPDIAKNAGLEVAPVSRRAVTQSLSCNAEITYTKNRYARLGPRASVIVSEIRKDLGDEVKEGELIALFHSVDIAIAKTDFLKHKENVLTAKLKLKHAKGTFERKNQIELRLAAVEYLKALELQKVSRKNVKREERLFASKATSEKEWLAAQAAASKADAAVRALGKKLTIYGVPAKSLAKLTWENLEKLQGQGTTSAQSYLEAQIALRVAEADLVAARKKLQMLGFTKKDIQTIIATSDSSGSLPLYAPFSGVLVDRQAVVGETAKPGDALFALADISRMWALIDIEEVNIANVRKGLPVLLQVQGLRGLNFKGTITWVSTKVDDKTRVLKARVELDNSKGLLRANMFARAHVLLRAEEPSLLIPKNSVQWDGCCNLVFVKLSERQFEPRKIQIAFETDDNVVINSGLTEKELVVTTGSFLLKTEILKGNIGAGCCGD